ncbi:MAG: hypothetical protein ACKPBU_01610 [Alphaproteobacteria bacterium]
MARGEEDPDSGVVRWIPILAVAVSALLAWQGVRGGNWRGVVVTEIQVLVVAAAAWVGLRGNRR